MRLAGTEAEDPAGLELYMLQVKHTEGRWVDMWGSWHLTDAEPTPEGVLRMYQGAIAPGMAYRVLTAKVEKVITGDQHG